MARESDGSRTLLLVIWTLYLLAIFALADFVLVLALFSHRDSDATLSTSLVLIFTSSILSIIYILLHLHFAYRYRQGCQPRQKRTCLESISGFLPRLLIIAWIAASANGLMVAARQPRCLPTTASHDLWRAGLSCTLHRSATCIAVGALIVTCALFCSIEVSNRPFHASCICIYRPRQDSSFGLTPTPSELNCSLGPFSGVRSGEREKTDHGRRAPTRQLVDRAFWLQRQNSLSSRKAIYPPCLHQSPGFWRPVHRSLRAASSPQVSVHRHWPSSPSHRSMRSASTSTSTTSLLPSVSEYDASVSRFPTRAPSSISSPSSPLSTMRRASQPDVLIIPNRFLGASSSSSSSSQASSRLAPTTRRSSLPFAWSPLLHHAPLSADPAIRALSTHNASAAQSNDHHPFQDPDAQHTSFLCPVEPALTVSKKSLLSRTPQRPDLPRRATGHRRRVRHAAVAAP